MGMAVSTSTCATLATRLVRPQPQVHVRTTFRRDVASAHRTMTNPAMPVCGMAAALVAQPAFPVQPTIPRPNVVYPRPELGWTIPFARQEHIL